MRKTERRRAISTKVFVGNLNFKTTREELSELLSGAGRVVDVHLPTDRETGKVRGFAFVQFSNEDEAAQAIKLFNGQDLGGRKLNINGAEDRPRRTDGPRPFRPSAPNRGFKPEVTTNWEDPFGSNPFGAANRKFKTKGSRRGLRGRKRSLNF